MLTFLALAVFLFCDTEASVFNKEKPERGKTIIDIFKKSNVDVPELIGKGDGKLPANKEFPFQTKVQWTEESQKHMRSKFTKEEIDERVVKDLSLELLMRGMSVGLNGIDFKPFGMKRSQLQDLGQQIETGDLVKEETEPIPDGLTANRRQKRTFAPRYQKFYMYWPNGTVPIYIDNATFSNPEYVHSLVKIATDHIESEVCVRFIKMSSDETNQFIQEGNAAFLHIFSDPTERCGSGGVGRTSAIQPSVYRGQDIYLRDRICLKVDTIIHQFAHALGMWNEYQRSDRDEHVKFNFENVIPGLESEFEKQDTKNRAPFDYASLMQDSIYANAIKRWIPTIEVRDPDLAFLMNLGVRLSHYDKMSLNKAYQCAANCPEVPCENGGYRHKDCSCRCPDGLQGSTCNEIVNSDVCGGIIEVNAHSKITVTSPNMSTLPPEGTTCYWLLKAPEDHAVTIEMSEFNLAWNNITTRCYHWLEMSYNLIGQPGPKFCGDSFPRGKISSTRFGEENLMMLKLDTESVAGVPKTGGFILTAQAYHLNGSDCPAPPEAENATNNYGETGGKIGAIVTYTCDEGNTLFGDTPAVTCQADGTWSNVNSFSCRFNEPIYTCDFQTDACNITQNPEIPGYSFEFTRFVSNGEGFLRVEPSRNMASSYYRIPTFGIPLSLLAYTEYCVSMSIKRPLGTSECAYYYLYSNRSLMYMLSYYCYDTEWTTIRTTVADETSFILYFGAQAAPGQSFNLDVDNITVRLGRC